MAKFTKQAIYSSFMKFLSEKPLGQITVKDIVDDCGINRKTFYYYYQDIYALADEMFREDIAHIKEKIPPDGHSWFEILKAISSYMYESRKVTLHVFKTIGYEKMTDVFYNTCLDYLPDFIKEQSEGLIITESDMELIVHYSAVFISGVLVHWISDGMKEIPVDLMERFSRITDGIARHSLENADRIYREEHR